MFVLLIAVILLMPTEVFGQNTAEHPGLKLMSYYADQIANPRTVNPYIVNIIAIYEISNGKSIVKVKNYINWYFEHLNYPDKAGLTGSIYDFEVDENGEEISTNDYDSVDGYAGTFLYLLNLYYIKTGDKLLIESNWGKIKDIAYLIPYLQGEDGLTRALPVGKNNARYLMDNCEAYAGIKAFNDLSLSAGYGQDTYYVQTAEKIKKAILNILYDKCSGNFYWAIYDDKKHISKWSVSYPDALAQLFPIYLDVLSANSQLEKHLWREFNKRYKSKIEQYPLEQKMIYEMTTRKMLKQKKVNNCVE